LAGQVDLDEPCDRIHRAVNVGHEPTRRSRCFCSTTR
jgi:hypothetical protein